MTYTEYLRQLPRLIEVHMALRQLVKRNNKSLLRESESKTVDPYANLKVVRLRLH